MTATERDPWRLAWTITGMSLRRLKFPGWGHSMQRTEAAALEGFRLCLRSMAGNSENGRWQDAHDAAIAAAQASIEQQMRERDPDTLKRWQAFRVQ